MLQALQTGSQVYQNNHTPPTHELSTFTLWQTNTRGGKHKNLQQEQKVFPVSEGKVSKA